MQIHRAPELVYHRFNLMLIRTHYRGGELIVGSVERILGPRIGAMIYGIARVRC